MSDRRAYNRPVQYRTPGRSSAPIRTSAPVRRPAPGGVFGAPARRYRALKWGLLVLLAVYVVLVVGANSARDVDFSVIRAALAAAPGVSGLKTLDENGFRERFDIAPEGEDWLLVGSEEIMDVSELLAAKGDEDALDRLDEAVRGRVEAQLAVFRSYGVDQKDQLEAAVILRRGDYLFYGVGPNATRWEDIFLSCIR